MAIQHTQQLLKNVRLTTAAEVVSRELHGSEKLIHPKPLPHKLHPSHLPLQHLAFIPICYHET